MRGIRKWLRKLTKIRRHILRTRLRRRLVFTGLFVLVLAIALETYSQTMPRKIDPTAYTPILNAIAKGESEGNYNAYFGNATNTTLRFTEMSVGEVLDWQQEYVRSGSPSSAVGRYQIIRSTLAGLVQELGLNPTARFDKTLQDRLAIALLERRGSEAYVGQEISREQFAANLAREWAALPKVIGDNPEQSYYAGDGLNASRVSIGAVYDALDYLKQ